MIELMQYYPSFGVRSGSPFCTKVELLLKMSGQQYKIKNIRDPRKSPKKKLPVIDDAGQIIPDSGFIQLHLEEKYQVDFYPGLSTQEKAQAQAIQIMIEEHLYWVIVHSRWQEDSNWSVIKKTFFGHIPALPALFVLPMIRKQAVKQLSGQGMGRHSSDEIYRLGARDLQILSDLLADKEWMIGSQKTALDCVVYAFLKIINIEELPSPIRASLRSHVNLMKFIKDESRFI